MDSSVTLIISTYNRCTILRETLAAVASLGEECAHEVLAVDDGSNDGTAELLEAWADASPRHRVHTQENSGALAARNAGAQASGSQYLIFIDDDIRPAPGFIRAHLDALERHPDSWVTGPVPDHVLPPSTAWERYRSRAVSAWEAALPDGPTRDPGWMTAANLGVRRQEFLGLGGFDDSLAMGGEDLDLMLRARESGIHLWFEPAVSAEHHDSFLTLPSFSRRQERYNQAVVSVWRRHGESSGLAHRIERNRPAELGVHGLFGSLGRLGRGAVASRAGLPLARAMATLGEALHLPERMQSRIYDVAVGGAICRGIRRGLRA